jgi:hypothetical protein
MSTTREPTPASDLILYQTEDGKTRIHCRFEDEGLWLTQAQIADLYQKDVKTINEHLLNIYEGKELGEDSTIRKFRIVRLEGKREVTREISHYSLQAILAVGFRVRSKRGTQFRQWANERLSEYLVKGFAMDDQRLKEPVTSGLHDYQPSDSEAQKMFQTVQNKLHFAVIGLTAPEIIAERVNPELLNMGLTSWKGLQVLMGDVKVAKNDLKEEEIKELNRIAGMFLDYTEDQAQRRKQVFLKDWPERLDAFLSLNDRQVLPDLGRVSREAAEQQAFSAYEQFNERRRLVAEDQGAIDAMAALEDAARLVERCGFDQEIQP